jgi:two-component sensor histidine kinase/uncharacterized protein YigA (DUF484 family)
MELGDELVKEQLFFRKELRERVNWFIQLRWVAAGGILFGSWSAHLQWPTLPVVVLNLIALLVLGYNIVFLLIYRRLAAVQKRRIEVYSLLVHCQVILDFSALYLLIYFTGGLSSPLIIFLILPVILTGILLSPSSCYLYCVSIVMILGGMTVLQILTVLPVQPAVFKSSVFAAGLKFPESIVAPAVFGAALFITAFLVTTLKLSLRTKGRALLQLSKELDVGNAKLTALYAMVKEMQECRELQALMDSATRNAAKIMGVKGCSIKLLDAQREKLRFASTYGLSEKYVKSKAGIDIAQSPINRRIIEGSLSAIGKIDEKDYFQYPEDIRREGIASMICLPLAVEKMVLGVFCVYSAQTYNFTDDDTRFFTLMADLTALAIENLQRETDRDWFLQKSAHQLRSPLSTVHSMLSTLQEGYLGPVSPQQAKNLNRCLKRLRALGDVVNDLLKFTFRRSELHKVVLHPVQAGNILKGLMEPYRMLAAEKKVDIAFDIEEPLPSIQADEKLVDELFVNLIGNAIKYTPPEGMVRVKLDLTEGNRLRFEVSDSGIGIAGEDIPRLFTEFFRAASARAFAEEGTGLGLVVVKEIVDHLKGSVTVKSAPGAGTSFTCRLPVVDRG